MIRARGQRAEARRQGPEARRQQTKLPVLCSLFSVLCLLSVSGCGYTTRSLLPAHIKTVYIDNFKNSIDITREVSSRKPYQLYSPGLEGELTRAVGDKFVFDGTLKVVKDRSGADAVLSGELLEYVREPLRYDEADDVTEFRIRVVASARFLDARDNKVIWQAEGISGESSQRTEGLLRKTEETARAEAVTDLARRIVEKTIEVW